MVADREMLISDAAEELANLINEAKEALLEESGLTVSENETGPGFYVGNPDDPETQEWYLNEDSAYAALGEMQEEYLEDVL